MAGEEALHLALPQPWRDRDPQASPAGIYTQRQSSGAIVLDDAQRQSAAGNEVFPLLNRSGLAGRQFFEEPEHGNEIM